MKGVLSLVSGVLFFAGFIPYVVAIVKGKTKPAKASWLIWAALDLITLLGMLAMHAVNGQIIGATCGAWVVALLALKYGTSGWTALDKFCLVGAGAGIALWQAFGNPTFGIVASLVVASLASIPTYVSAWRDPGKEDRAAWTIFWLSCVVALFAIPDWTFADAAQPMTFAVFESVMMAIVWLRPRLGR